jgi:hypothetical protein
LFFYSLLAAFCLFLVSSSLSLRALELDKLEDRSAASSASNALMSLLLVLTVEGLAFSLPLELLTTTAFVVVSPQLELVSVSRLLLFVALP